MKWNDIRRTLVALVAVVATDTMPAENRARAAAAENITAAVRVAGAAGEQRLRDFLHRPVLDVAGTNLGTVEDFLVERTSGRIAFAVVFVPDAPLHNARRVLRADAFRWQRGSSSFEVKAPAELSVDEPEAVLSYDTFVRASALSGHAVRSGNRVIGRITDVAIDLGTRTAAPVLTPDATVMKTQRSFVLPLSRVRVTAEPEVAVTTVTPEELARAEVAAASVAVNGSLPTSPVTGASGISQSSVTGQTGYSTPQTVTAATTEATETGVFNESSAARRARAGTRDSELLGREAQSVRRALLELSSTAGEAVDVSVEDGKLVLRGFVPSAAVKNEFEEAAAAAVRGVPVESRLSVRRSSR